jgi:phosphate transport system permease protein
VTTHEITAPALRSEHRRTGETLIKVGLGLAALVSVLTTVGIVVALLVPSVQFFQQVNPIDYLTGLEWTPLFQDGKFGVIPLVIGTLNVTFWACLFGLPLGLGTAIYLSEYAKPKTRATIKPILEVLAGIPTVVFGYFALTFVTPLIRDLGVGVGIFNVLAPGLVMGVMLIPTVASLSEDAMSAVPRDLREGAYALGARRMAVATKVVVPAATSGIIASFVLAISRAIGETMIVVIAAGSQPVGVSWPEIFDPRQAMETMTAFVAATGAGDIPTGSLEYKTIFAVGLTLFLITMVMNMISIRLVRKFREVYE